MLRPAAPSLSFALRTKQHDRRMGLSWLQHLTLLLGYARGKVDVHGGYFQGDFCRQLMYRFACLGYGATVEAMAASTSSPPGAMRSK